jgi:hydroxypyruvate isomerase
MYGSLPFLERLDAAAADGFRCVEFWVAPEKDAAAERLGALGLAVSAINVSPGGEPADAGQLSDPAKVDWWRQEFLQTLDYAGRIGCAAINVLVGGRADLARSEQFATLVENLDWALARTPEGTALLLEPLNRLERPHYLLHSVRDAQDVLQTLGFPAGLRLLFDAYHLYQDDPDLPALYRASAHHVGHVQIADCPGRGAPGTGLIEFAPLWDVLSAYDGWVGLEYSAQSDGLAWLEAVPQVSLVGQGA